MKKSSFCTAGFAVFAACFMAQKSTAADPVVLVKDGVALAAIELPAEAGEPTRMAAQELRDYVRKISGAEIPILKSGETSTRSLRITLTPKRLLASGGEYLGTDAQFTIATAPEGLSIRGETEVAVLYGAYQWLSELGVRWYMPGDIGENVPASKTISCPVGTRDYAPDFLQREIALSTHERQHLSRENKEQQVREYALWLLRNRIQFGRWISGLSPFKFNNTPYDNAHALHEVLRGIDIEKEPERFPLVTRDGVTRRRPNSEQVQICFTNPKNIAHATELAQQFFKAHPDRATFPLSLNDWGGVCECPACVQANGGVSPVHDPNRLVWTFMNEVARRVRVTHPHKTISIFAIYVNLLGPPEGVKADPGVMAVSCHTQCNAHRLDDSSCPYNVYHLGNIQRAIRAGANLGCYEYTMFQGSTQPLSILDNVTTYKKLGYKFYHCESMGRDEQRNIVSWVLAQLLWDSKSDPGALLRTFCREYYGKAGDDVLAALLLIDDNVKRLPIVIWNAAPVEGEVYRKSMGLLDQALAKVSGRERQRLERLISTIQMQGMIVRGDQAIAAMVNERTEASRAEAVRALEDFRQFWNANRLGETVSPVILEHEEGLLKMVATHPLKLTPKAAKNLAGAPDSEKKELFAMAEVPATLGNLFFLPEIWKFRLDPDMNVPASEWVNPAFDDSKWGDISTWQFFNYQGTGYYLGGFCYRVRFESPVFPAGRRVYLRVGSIDDDGTFYLNGKNIHTRIHIKPNDWESSFEIDVTDTLLQGRENVLVVKGKSAFGGAGLWRPTALYTR